MDRNREIRAAERTNQIAEFHYHALLEKNKNL